MRYFIILVFLLLMTSCSIDPTRDEVTLRISGETLVIKNGTDEDIYFHAAGASILVVFQLLPKVDEENKVA